MLLENQHLTEFERELAENGLPGNPALIVGRMVQFTTAIMGKPEGDRPGFKTPECCFFEDAGVDLLSVDEDSLEASFATPLTFVAIISGVSYDSNLGFVNLHVHPLDLEGHWRVTRLNLLHDMASLRFAEESEAQDPPIIRGKFKLL